jgi:hypothetical protein
VTLNGLTLRDRGRQRWPDRSSAKSCSKSEIQMITQVTAYSKRALRTMAEPPPDAVPAVEEQDDDGATMLAHLCCALRLNACVSCGGWVGVSAGRTVHHVHGWCGLKIDPAMCNIYVLQAWHMTVVALHGAGWWCLYQPHTTRLPLAMRLIAASVCVETNVSRARTPCAWCLLSQTSCTHNTRGSQCVVRCVHLHVHMQLNLCKAASMSAPPCLQYCQAMRFTHRPADMHIHNAFTHSEHQRAIGGVKRLCCICGHPRHSMWPALAQIQNHAPHALRARNFLDRPVHPLPMAQARGSLTHARPSNSAAAARYVDEKEPVC